MGLFDKKEENIEIDDDALITTTAKVGLNALSSKRTIKLYEDTIKIFKKEKLEKTIPLTEIKSLDFSNTFSNPTLIIFLKKGKVSLINGAKNLGEFKNKLEELSSDHMEKNQSIKIEETKEKVFAKYGATEKPGMITWFEAALKEARATVTNNQQVRTVSALAIVYSDHIEIFKKSALTSKTKGVKKIFFKNITSIDLDTPGTLSVTYSIEITLSGSKRISLASANPSIPEIYAKLDEAFSNYQTNDGNDVIANQSSSTDELSKIIDMYEKGLLTDDEFIAMKSKIINN